MDAGDVAYLRCELDRVTEQRMPFGYFRGWHVRDVPGDYLRWCLRSVPLSPGLRAAVEDTLRRRIDNFWSARLRRQAALRCELGL
jgi:hypothetical protein